MAARDNLSPSDVDKTSFFWAGLCAICHPGGGPAEFDRDGFKYYDAKLQKWGYERANKTPGPADGDYSVFNSAGQLVKAAWDKTGVSEPDCLMCHKADHMVAQGKNMNWVWRAATLRGGAALVDASGGQVAAYAAASTAALGWHSKFEFAPTPPGKPPKAKTVQIDYKVAIASGQVREDSNGRLHLLGKNIVETPKDNA